MNSALILGRNNGVGLDRDAALVRSALESGGIACRAPAIRSLSALLSGAHRADVAIHLERIFPWWRPKAGRHFLIPNQERFPERHLGRLKKIDRVLCKSRHAEEIFSQHHPAVRFIGFTSPDRLSEEIQPDYGAFLHLAGRSTLKNTDALLDLWSRHPEWPELTLVQHPDNAPASVPPNVKRISRYVPDDELLALQNRCGVHLCPSLSEGWGHYIVEGMSCRAVVITTDAPPMNEIVGPDRGITVSWTRREPRHLGWNFHADPAALESEILRVIAMKDAEKAELGSRARAWYEENDRDFPRRLLETMA